MDWILSSRISGSAMKAGNKEIKKGLISGTLDYACCQRPRESLLPDLPGNFALVNIADPETTDHKS
jgi:hypothetical protein